MVIRSLLSLLLVLLIDGKSVAAFAPASKRHSAATFIASAATTELSDGGILKTISKPGTGPPLKLGDVASVKYSCYLPNDESKAPFAKSNFQKVSVGDGSMIDGWEKALRTMSVGERAIVRITNPELGYGEIGVPPFIPANAELELDLEVLDAQPPLDAMDFDTLAMTATPRTAGSIAAAYEERQLQKEPEKEGFEGWLEKVRNFYFFGFFEGETGQQAPWFLRPSITFPLAFLVVGAAFYVSYIGGAISERGAQVTDELDDFILSNLVLTKSALIVMLSNGGNL